jgi:hypothetical protein
MPPQGGRVRLHAPTIAGTSRKHDPAGAAPEPSPAPGEPLFTRAAIPRLVASIVFASMIGKLTLLLYLIATTWTNADSQLIWSFWGKHVLGDVLGVLLVPPLILAFGRWRGESFFFWFRGVARGALSTPVGVLVSCDDLVLCAKRGGGIEAERSSRCIPQVPRFCDLTGSVDGNRGTTRTDWRTISRWIGQGRLCPLVPLVRC